ncbi:isochorismatase family protein [Streptomyces bambusae]|uniref:Isochorismatase family protein n=1 Tax=Streptomyces bambusae TaxID=1550616 RepID=A0ABS6ZF45_9ACTN|nr:isochorismatase family protein [Streptomyces bambusae]MBW5486382.1 isochorismatase family protein [Streptomyces bambusae]
MAPEPLSPANTTIVLVDYAVGFANIIGSHDLAQHVNNAVGLAKTAKWYGSGLVVTNGEASKPSGPLYPELLDVLGDQPVVERPVDFNAFHDEAFARAVRAEARENLVIGGISTEGCVLQTVLGGLREGYRVHVVADACAGLTAETHNTALQRMVQAGAVPVTWFSLAAEFQLDPKFHDAPHRLRLMREHVPAMAMSARSFGNAVEQGRRTAAER